MITTYLGQDANLSYTYLKDNQPYNLFSVNKIEIYNSVSNAINNSELITSTTTINNTSTGVYEWIILKDYLKTENIYFFKFYFIVENGGLEENIIESFLVKRIPDIIPSNAINIEYSERDLFKNENGTIRFNDYSSDLLLYSDFDTSVSAKYAKINTDSDIIGTPNLIAGGVFGNYVSLQNSSIRYNYTNFDNNYRTNTVDFRLRLGFDNGLSFREFLTNPKTGEEILKYDQKPLNAIFYVSYNSSINANWGEGSLTATSFNSATYEPGGKFNGSLKLSLNKYLTYNSNNNTTPTTGSLSFWVKPNYIGSPVNNQNFIKIWNTVDNNNALYFSHLSSGQLHLSIYDKLGTSIIDNDLILLTPNSLTWYNIEINYDLINGETRVFLDGIQIGSFINTGDRTANYTKIQIGDEFLINNFDFDEFLINSSVQHTTNFTPSSLENNQIVPLSDTYGFKLKINNSYINSGNDIIITIDSIDTFQTIANKIMNEIENSSCVVINNKIRITANNVNWSVDLEPPSTVNNLIDTLGGISEKYIPNGPSNDNIIFQYYNGINNNDRILLVHSTIGELILKMYNSSGNLIVNNNFGIWSSVSNNWYNITLCFNSNTTQLFIDGSQIGQCVPTLFTRNNPLYFYINSSSNDDYGFDELKIYNSYKYNENYIPTVFALTKYPQSRPYVIFNWGVGIKIPKNLDVVSNGTFTYIPIIDEIPYYYIAGSWQISNGTWNESSTLNDFQNNLTTLPFNENENFKIKVFFISDGIIDCVLNKLYLIFPIIENPDYTPVINWVRGKLGEPIIPIELTNDQIELNLQESLAKWEYYRYHKEDVMTTFLDGNEVEGYKIPDGWENFYDIIFSPQTPIAGILSTNDLSKNMFIQYFYSMISSGGSGVASLSTDYYLTLNAISDMNITFGTQITWRVFNNRLFIYPDPGREVKVGLIKPRAPSIQEINNDIWIKKYTLALSKISLGDIRESIGTVPMGMENLQLNGSQLKSEGQTEVDRLEAEFKAKMEPLFVYFI